jgi:pimeloyl-ACP methyl ester carboxylesterase
MSGSNITRRNLIGSGIAAGVGLTAATAPGEIVGSARAQSAPKTFVLIHGTYCGGWYWRLVSDLLEKKGHDVFSPTLTGLGERSHLLSKDIHLDTQIADIVNVLKWEELRDVCLVAHSYGGWIGSGALEHIGDRVSSIIWVDAFTGRRSETDRLYQRVHPQGRPKFHREGRTRLSTVEGRTFPRQRKRSRIR